MKKMLGALAAGLVFCVVGVNDTFAAAVELYSTPLFSDANLVFYYRLEGNSNDSKDSNNGTGSVTYNASYGKFGQGVYIDGAVFNYIQINAPNSFNWSTHDWSVSAWANMLAGTNSYARGIFTNRVSGSGGWFTLGWNGYDDSCMQIETQGGALTSGYNPIGTGWHLYTVTYTASGAVFKLYLDGIVQTLTGTQGTVGNTTQTTCAIGVWGQSWPWNGYIDDVAFFIRALTATEVSNLYDVATPTPTITPTPTPTQTPTITPTPDTVPPVVPVITSCNWDFTSGKITSITGTGENGTTLTFYDKDGGTISGTPTWDGSGTFTFTPTTSLAPGSTVYVKSQDGATNTSQSGTHVVIFEDYMDIFPDIAVFHGTGSGTSMRMEKDTSCDFNIAVNKGDLSPDPDKPVTVKAYMHYNTEYGTAAKPKITLSGLGISGTETGQSAVATEAALTDWELLSVSGIPNAKGVVTLKVATFSTADGAKAWVDDISVSQ